MKSLQQSSVRVDHLAKHNRTVNSPRSLPLFEAGKQPRSMGFRTGISETEAGFRTEGEPRIVPLSVVPISTDSTRGHLTAAVIRG